jgi:hypothetical protein
MTGLVLPRAISSPTVSSIRRSSAVVQGCADFEKILPIVQVQDWIASFQIRRESIPGWQQYSQITRCRKDSAIECDDFQAAGICAPFLCGDTGAQPKEAGEREHLTEQKLYYYPPPLLHQFMMMILHFEDFTWQPEAWSARISAGVVGE